MFGVGILRFAKNFITIPRVSKDQYNSGVYVSYSNLRTGDLVFFATGTTGVGNGQFINASEKKGVTFIISIVGARRVIN
jgi:cell wall-associated NlpC family hydrolase